MNVHQLVLSQVSLLPQKSQKDVLMPQDCQGFSIWVFYTGQSFIAHVVPDNTVCEKLRLAPEVKLWRSSRKLSPACIPVLVLGHLYYNVSTCKKVAPLAGVFADFLTTFDILFCAEQLVGEKDQN